MPKSYFYKYSTCYEVLIRFNSVVPNRGATNRAFHGFLQAKFPYRGLVLGSSQFLPLPQLPQKTTLNLKIVNFDSKIHNHLASLI